MRRTKEPKTKVNATFNLTAEQVEVLHQMAEAEGRSASDVLRRILKWYVHREVATKEAKMRQEARLRKLIEEGV